MSDDHTLEDIEAILNGAVEDEEDPNEEEVVEESEEEVDEEEHAPAEEEDEDDLEAEAPELQQEDDWEDKARKIQSAKDREVAELQRQLAELREAQAEARGREEARRELGQQDESAQAAAVTAEDLQQGILTNLPHTFQWTVANRPDLVPNLVTMVRETEGYGHGVADQMIVEYNAYLNQQTVEQQQSIRDEIKEAQEAAQAPLQARQAMDNVVEDLTERFGETFKAAQDEISQRMQTDGREYIKYLQSEDPDFQVTPGLVRDMMIDIYLEIRENALNEQSMQPTKPAKVPAGAQALGQSATTDRPDDDEDLLASFISGARDADITVDPSFLP